MLKKLLKLIAEAHGSVLTAEFARTLGMSEEMVGQMTEELARLGYLAQVGAGCGESACRGCPKVGACAVPSQSRVWRLTDKGLRFAA